jgi:hypothetical protein
MPPVPKQKMWISLTANNPNVLEHQNNMPNIQQFELSDAAEIWK